MTTDKSIYMYTFTLFTIKSVDEGKGIHRRYSSFTKLDGEHLWSASAIFLSQFMSGSVINK